MGRNRERTMTIIIRRENALDRDAICKVNRLAFGNNAEANLVGALRDSGFVAVSLVAEMNGKVVGHILFIRVQISGKTGILESLSLAPMAVLPEFQRQRIGSKLLTVGLATCRAMGHKIVLVLGHPEFYQRFGFSGDHSRLLIAARCRIRDQFSEFPIGSS